MTLDDKLSQLRNLLAQRDDIDRQLESIIGANREVQPAPKPETETRPAHKRSKGARGKRRTDPEFEKRTAKILELAGKGWKAVDIAEKLGCPKQTVYNTISRHGGGMHAITKRDGSTDDIAPAEPKTKPLDGDEYESLRDAMYDRDFSSAQYALSHKLSPREVNAAIKSKDYDDYLDSR